MDVARQRNAGGWSSSAQASHRWRFRAAAIGLSLSGCAFADAAEAEPEPCPRTQFLNLRYEEDWRFLADPRCRRDAWDPIKHIDLDGGRSVSLGGEARIRYERFDNPGWGADPEDLSGYLLQRYLLHGDLRLSPRVRLFGQLESSRENGRVNGPRETDEDRLDVNQFFADWTPVQEGADRVTLRLGRQEVEIGSSQFTSARNGLNDRLSFDGIRAFGEVKDWRFHAMTTRVVQTRRGVFDDSPDRQDTLSGFFIARSHDLVPGADSHAVVYVNRRTDATTRYQDGSLREERMSIGTRWWGRSEHWDYNYELGAQRGDFGPGSIRAWYLSTDTGYRLDRVSRPRLGLRFNVGSGDRKRGDGELNTFSPMFAATAYSGLAGLVGPSNSIGAAPSVSFEVDESKVLSFGMIGFWRQSAEDGVYNIFTEVQRRAAGSRARHVGNQYTVQFVWQITPHASWLTTISYFTAGRFLRETPPGENVTYLTTWWAYRF